MKKPVSIFVMFIIFIITIFMLFFYSSKAYKKELGEKTVKCLYEFETPQMLDRNMIQLKKYVTDEVFSQLTIDNEERTLNTYLKFKDSAVRVNIVRSTDSYVLYQLNTDAISSDRIFLFLFDAKFNKISYVREVECLDFIENDY